MGKLSVRYIVSDGMLICGKHLGARFNRSTRAAKGLLSSRPMLEWYIDNLVTQLVKEQIMYAELRPTFILPDSGHTIRIDKHVQIFSDGRERNRDRMPLGFKLVYCAPRSVEREIMIAHLEKCIELALRHPSLICGR